MKNHFVRHSLILLMIVGLISCDTLQKISDGMSGTGGITSSEAAGGLKEALLLGMIQGTNLLSKEDGFFGNNLVKIPWPEEADFVKTAMEKIGMGDRVENVTKSLNRAAEKAAGEAVDVFVGSVKQMTFQDAMGILGGGNGAGTAYFQRTTTNILTEKFRPIIESSLASVNATKIWSDVIGIYNNIPFTNKKVETDLTAFVTRKALEGVFKMVEIKENEIRDKASARTSGLLQKVFGYADTLKTQPNNTGK